VDKHGKVYAIDKNIEVLNKLKKKIQKMAIDKNSIMCNINQAPSCPV
jgi:precorrin-6B methylase 2